MADRSTNIPGNQIEDDTIKQTELDITNTPTDGQIVKINMPTGDFTAIDAGVGDVTAGANITDNRIVRGDGGSKGIQQSTASISDNGEMTNISQPGFSVENSVAQNNIATAGETIVLDQERFDIGSNFASNTFTSPVTGKYLLNAFLSLANMDNVPSQYQFKLITSNKTYSHQVDPRQFSGDVAGEWTMSFSVLADMDIGDTATLTIDSNSAGTAQADILINRAQFNGYLAF